MMTNRYLPVGSVVIINGKESRPVMLTGYSCWKDGKMYDYRAVPYPSGMATDGAWLLFDAENIDRVVFMGLQHGRDGEVVEAFFEEMKKRSADVLSQQSARLE